MLTLTQLRDALSVVDYMPDWELRIWEPDIVQGPYLTIDAEVPNSYRPEETVELHIHSPIPPVRTAQEFYDWLLWRLKQAAVHEVMEWFRVDGKPYIDPHSSLDR